MAPAGDDSASTTADGRGQDLDARRLRGTRNLLLAGTAVGVIAAAAVGGAGGSGALGLGALLLVWALTAVTAGLAGVALAIVDEWRRHRVARRRMALVVALLPLAFVLLVMAVGALGG